MKDLTNIKNRVKYYIDNQNIKKSQFYKKTGVSYGILCQKSKMSEDNIVKILTSYPDINTDWLVLGIGEMLKNDEVQEIAADPITYEKLLDEIKELVKINNENLLKEIKRLNKNTEYKTYTEQDHPINLVADDQKEKFRKTKKKEK